MLQSQYILGYVIAEEDLSLQSWDEHNQTISIKKGDKIDISYFEYDGSFGFYINGIEYFCHNKDRSKFREYWKK